MKHHSAKPILRVLALSLLAVCCMATAALAADKPTAAQQNEIEAVMVNGVELRGYLEEHPGMGYAYFDDNSRTMVPLRAIGDILGVQTEYRPSDKAIIIDGGMKEEVVFHIGSTGYTVDGISYQMDTIPVSIEDRTHIPVRFLVEALGGSVYYDESYGHRPVIEIYFHKNDVVPTPPDWAKDDYVTFDRTSVYMPENWAFILRMREMAARGEDFVKIEGYSEFSRKFRLEKGNRKYDCGYEYESLLLSAMYYKNAQNSNRQSYCLGIIDMTGPEEVANRITHSKNPERRQLANYTPEQSHSILRWRARQYAAMKTQNDLLYNLIGGLYYQNRYGVNMNNENGIRSYNPSTVNVFGKSIPEFLSEDWFDTVPYVPQPIFFDDDCARAPLNSGKYPTTWSSGSVYTQDGVTWVDLELIGSGLSLKRGIDDYNITSPSIAWAKEERDADGSLTAVEMDRDGTIIRVEKASSIAKVGNKKIQMGAAVVIGERGHLYVPMSFLTDVLGETVTYDKVNGVWLVNRNHQVSDPNLEKWALAMCAVMSRRGDANPYYLGMYNRCLRTQTQFVPSPYNPDAMMRSYTFLPAYNYAASQLERSWNCTSAEDIRTEAQFLTTAPNEQYPAWDLFRVAHISSWGYAAGYLTADEALALVKPAAQKLQQAYTCWDDAYAGWINGYQALFGGDEEECALRRSIYEDLKADQANRGLLFDDGLFQRPI